MEKTYEMVKINDSEHGTDQLSDRESQLHVNSSFDEVQNLTRQVSALKMSLIGLTLFTIVGYIILLIKPKQVIVVHSADDSNNSNEEMTITYQTRTIRNIAFGSCTSYDLREQTIWKDAIIPSNPDVWIWLGDMVYLDDNEINCNQYQNTIDWQQSCNCTADYIHTPPYSCHAGDMQKIVGYKR
jgi:hypothetical protein